MITIFKGGSMTGNLLSSAQYDHDIRQVIFPTVLKAIRRLFPEGLEEHIRVTAQR
jgi:hypothetical protein